MSEKRPLDAIEKMVNTLPPVNKKPRKKKPKIEVVSLQPPPPPPPSPAQPQPSAIEYLTPPVQQEQDEAMAKLLDSLITAEPIPSAGHLPMANNQPTQPAVEVVQEKHYDWNLCPFHKCNLTAFETRTDGETYIKCPVNQCPIFTHEGSAYYYMTSVYEKLHLSYLKRNESLVFSCEEPLSLRVSKTETNPGRPYFVCKDCRFFQWADVKLSKRNKKKQRKRVFK